MTRRFFQCIGTSVYPEGISDLPGVNDEMDTVAAIFRDRFGYQPAIGDGKLLNPQAADLAGSDPHPIKSWLHAPERTTSDVLAIYYTGHGKVFSQGTGYRIIPTDFQAGKQDSTTVSPEDLLFGFLDEVTPVRNVLLILDTCHAGESVPDLARTILNGVCADASKPRSVRVLCSCWPQESATVARLSKALEVITGPGLSLEDSTGECLEFSRLEKLLADEIAKTPNQKLDPCSRGVFSDFFPLGPWRSCFGKSAPSIDPATLAASLEKLMPLLDGVTNWQLRRCMPRALRCAYDPLWHRDDTGREDLEVTSLRGVVDYLASRPVCGGCQPLLHSVLVCAADTRPELRLWVAEALQEWAAGADAGKLEAAIRQDREETSAATPTLKIVCSAGLDGVKLEPVIQSATYWIDYQDDPGKSERLHALTRSDYQSTDGKTDQERFFRSAEVLLHASSATGPVDQVPAPHFLLPAVLIEHPVECWPVHTGPDRSRPTGAVYDVTVSALERCHYPAVCMERNRKLALRDAPPDPPFANLSQTDSASVLEEKLANDVFMACGEGNQHTAKEVVQSGIPYACWNRNGYDAPDLSGTDISQWKASVRRLRRTEPGRLVLFWDDETTTIPKGAAPLRPPQYAA